MATTAATTSDPRVTDLIKQLDSIIACDIERLVREGDLGQQLSFSGARPTIIRIISLARELREQDLRAVSTKALAKIREAISSIVQGFQQLQNFSVQNYGSDPIRARNELNRNVEEAADKFFEVAAPVIAYVKVHEPLAPETVSRAQALLDSIEQRKSEQDKLTAVAAERAIEAERILDNMRLAASQAGVQAHAGYFEFAAREHRRAALGWLGAVVAGSSTLIYFAWISYRNLVRLIGAAGSSGATSLPTGAVVQLAVAKIILFSVAFTAIIWMGRMYRAHRHNYIVNTHRVNALRTFEAFAKATDDGQTKNAVLLQATQCIFAPQNTGYVGHDTDSEALPKIIEIVKSVAKEDRRT